MIVVKAKLPNSDQLIDQIFPCLQIINQLDKQKDQREVVLDMSELEWALPLSTLLLSNKITDLKKEGTNITVKPPLNTNVKNYLKTIGFPLGKGMGGTTYSPIYHFGENANAAANVAFDIIDRQFPKSDKLEITKYMVGELAANVEDHSEFTHATVASQYYFKKKFVDMGMIDNGITIPALFRKKNIPFETDAEAIDKAIHGVSTKTDDGRGRGLTFVKRVVNEGLKGQLLMISRNGAVVHDGENRKLYKLAKLKLRGTVVYSRFEMPKTKIKWGDYVE